MVYLPITLCYLQILSSVALVFQVQAFYLHVFIPRYFILFDAMVNGIVFSVSLSDISLLVYRNATDFFFF